MIVVSFEKHHNEMYIEHRTSIIIIYRTPYDVWGFLFSARTMKVRNFMANYLPLKVLMWSIVCPVHIKCTLSLQGYEI